MQLAVDIGNSNIKLGVWNDSRWIQQWRLETHPVNDPAGYSQAIRKRFSEAHISLHLIKSVILGSVVPAATTALMQGLSSLFHCNLLPVDVTLDTGLKIDTDDPTHVGTDLIAGAVGACRLTGAPCIIVDFGTATTVSAIQKPARFSGVAICAGLKVSIEALIGKTAQLQHIPIEVPPSPIGKNTIQAMQSGLVLGHVCMVEGLIDRMRKEMDEAKVIATGGLVSLLAPHSTHFDFVEPTLVLDGLRAIAERQ